MAVPFENGKLSVAFFAFSGKTAKDFPLSNGLLPLGFYQSATLRG